MLGIQDSDDDFDATIFEKIKSLDKESSEFISQDMKKLIEVFSLFKPEQDDDNSQSDMRNKKFSQIGGDLELVQKIEDLQNQVEKFESENQKLREENSTLTE